MKYRILIYNNAVTAILRESISLDGYVFDRIIVSEANTLLVDKLKAEGVNTTELENFIAQSANNTTLTVEDNIASQEGDVIIIKTDTPVLGLIGLTDLIDSTTGETASTYFKKEFRYTVDGINYSDWIPLTKENLAKVIVKPSDIFIAEYKYERIGSEGGDITFNSVTVSGNTVALEEGESYKKSIFKEVFGVNDNEVLLWAINVTEKLYKKGLIVPSYIERGETYNLEDDRDYIDFWRTVAHFFALFVVYARKVNLYKTNEAAWINYLKQRNLFIANSSNLEQLNYLTENLLAEFRRRGTIKIAQKGNIVDGELLRLLNYKAGEEFHFSLLKADKAGWCIGKSSPLYKGTAKDRMINKSYENDENITDLSKYPLVYPTKVTSVVDAGKQVMKITGVDLASGAGIGGSTNISKAITVSDEIDYEISFKIKQVGVTGNITASCIALDINNNIVNLKDLDDLATDNNFFLQNNKLNKDNKYYKVKCILFSKNKKPVSPDKNKLNIGIGRNLKMREGVVKIIPSILLQTTVLTQELYIYDLQIKTLNYGSSLGLVNSNNLVAVIAKNNNAAINKEQLIDNIRKFLVPYNTQFFVNLFNKRKTYKTSAIDIAVLAHREKVSSPGANDGFIEVVGLGGSGSYAYSWSNGATTARIENLLAGTYTVTVYDYADRTKSATATFVIN